MSGQFPTSVGVRSVSIVSQRANFRSETMSLRTQVRHVGGQRWKLRVVFPPMARSDFGAVFAFIEQQKGGSESFTFLLPVFGDKSGDVGGSPLTSASGAVGDTSISVDGYTGTFKAGNFFKFANHDKVYTVSEDLAASSGTLNFQPELSFAVSDNEALTVTQVPFTVRLLSDLQEYDIGVDSLVSYEVDLIEVV